jgi:hypothetical protein
MFSETFGDKICGQRQSLPYRISFNSTPIGVDYFPYPQILKLQSEQQLQMHELILTKHKLPLQKVLQHKPRDAKVTKLFSLSLVIRTNKLECFSLACVSYL